MTSYILLPQFLSDFGYYLRLAEIFPRIRSTIKRLFYKWSKRSIAMFYSGIVALNLFHYGHLLHRSGLKYTSSTSLMILYHSVTAFWNRYLDCRLVRRNRLAHPFTNSYPPHHLTTAFKSTQVYTQQYSFFHQPPHNIPSQYLSWSLFSNLSFKSIYVLLLTDRPCHNM